ncbi:hypothetical protein [Alicyclobacillus tolerans]|uniref:hypothetical protein n=1 Tax=Alicyclobacillus tolerans TaxID=90970 RepID=UPI003B97E886
MGSQELPEWSRGHSLEQEQRSARRERDIDPIGHGLPNQWTRIASLTEVVKVCG